MTEAFGCVGNTIRTRSGKYLDLVDPNPDQITLGDIACGLSRICRFGGQIDRWYSVAEHSYHCCRIAMNDGRSNDACKAALMHDASEAFIGDVVKPLKQLLCGYDLVENRLMKIIGEKFDVDFEFHEETTKEIDRAMLIAERKRMFEKSECEPIWHDENKVRPLNIEFYFWDYRDAETMFSLRARELGMSFSE
jgi:5'-deoxynucleotidase YfbR-like HD superfamily hydrolase